MLRSDRAAALSTAQIASFTPTQARAIAGEGLRPDVQRAAAGADRGSRRHRADDHRALTTAAAFDALVRRLSAAREFASLGTASINGLSTGQIQVLTAFQIAALTTDQIRSGLTTTQIRALTCGQLQALTSVQMAAMTTSQIRALPI